MSKRKQTQAQRIAAEISPFILQWDHGKAIAPEKYIRNLIDSEFPSTDRDVLVKTLRDLKQIIYVFDRLYRRIERQLEGK